MLFGWLYNKIQLYTVVTIYSEVCCGTVAVVNPLHLVAVVYVVPCPWVICFQRLIMRQKSQNSVYKQPEYYIKLELAYYSNEIMTTPPGSTDES